jgi:NAD(P)-dependent dehydrogenase (short-subunit alcohol dehydrogenase family)
VKRGEAIRKNIGAMMLLNNKTAIVTGGNSGIGQAMFSNWRGKARASSSITCFIRRRPRRSITRSSSSAARRSA